MRKFLFAIALTITVMGPAAASAQAPDPHANGGPFRFFYWVGMVPSAEDTRNPACNSNIVTMSEKVDWKAPGASGRAFELAGRYENAFIMKCQRYGTIIGPPMPMFDRGGGQFIYRPHPTEVLVTLP